MSEGCIRLPLSHYPGMNRLVLDWLAGGIPELRRFDASKGARREAPGAGSAPALLDALVASNRRWGSFISRNDLRAWADGETVTLVAGQQVGFAGGPLYTLAKIASLLKIKRQLAREGRRVTIFFWLATEDHDYDEVATLYVPASSIPSAKANAQLDLVCLRAAAAVESRAAVGPLPIPEPLIVQLLALYGIDRPAWLREGVTFRDSFAELLVSIFGGEIILVDSLLPELRRAAAPLLESILARWHEAQAAFASDSADLEKRGYRPQIDRREDGSFTLLFRIDEEGRRRIVERPEPPGDVTTLSTSAATRPLLQDYLFAPDLFVGGPAEVAYYAQQVRMHELFGVPMPAIALRGHVLVAPQKMLRAFSRYEIAPEEVFAPPDEVVSRREEDGVREIRSIASKAHRDLAAALTRIGEIALPAEHALARALSRSIGHIEYHFDKMTERAIRALVRKDRERYAAVRELVATFHPDRQVQDRVVGWFPWWCQYGKQLVDRIVDEIEPDSDAFKMIGL